MSRNDIRRNVRVGVIGLGTVGSAVARSWHEHCRKVFTYDTHAPCNSDLATVFRKSHFSFICVPEDSVGGLTHQIKLLIDADNSKVPLFILRSTVPIGTTRRLQERLPVIHMPEFLTARCANHDAENPRQNIMGVTENIINTKPFATFVNILNERFPHTRQVIAPPEITEAVKLIINGFFAVKVAYFNEVSYLFKEIGGGDSWTPIKEIMLGDGRINPSHTEVPGPDGGFGYGGTCLPKDVAQLVNELEERGYMAALLKATQARNEIDRRRQPCED